MCRIVHILWQILFIICIDNNILFHPKATTWGAFSCIKIPDRFFSKWKTPIRPRMCNMCKNECESRVCFAFSGRKSLFFFGICQGAGGWGIRTPPLTLEYHCFQKPVLRRTERCAARRFHQLNGGPSTEARSAAPVLPPCVSGRGSLYSV